MFDRTVNCTISASFSNNFTNLEIQYGIDKNESKIINGNYQKMFNLIVNCNFSIKSKEIRFHILVYQSVQAW